MGPTGPWAPWIATGAAARGGSGSHGSSTLGDGEDRQGTALGVVGLAVPAAGQIPLAGFDDGFEVSAAAPTLEIVEGHPSGPLHRR